MLLSVVRRSSYVTRESLFKSVADRQWRIADTSLSRTTYDERRLLMHSFRQIFVYWYLPQGVAQALQYAYKRKHSGETVMPVANHSACATMKPAVPHWKREGGK